MPRRERPLLAGKEFAIISGVTICPHALTTCSNALTDCSYDLMVDSKQLTVGLPNV